MSRLTQKIEYDGIVKYEMKSMHPSVYGIHKLGEFEDKYEQGTLIELPCRVGDTVYVISTCGKVKTVLDGNYETATGYYCPFELSNLCPHDCDDCNDVKTEPAIFEDTISYIGIDEIGVHLFTENTGMCCTIGKDTFFTKEEAKKALAKQKGEQND